MFRLIMLGRLSDFVASREHDHKRTHSTPFPLCQEEIRTMGAMEPVFGNAMLRSMLTRDRRTGEKSMTCSITASVLNSQ